MRPLHLFVCLSFAACASGSLASGERSARTPAAETEREVIAVAEALFSAMRDSDTTAIRALFLPEVRIVSFRDDGSSATTPQSRSVSAFVTSISRSGDELNERMRDPRVEVSGDLATLWTPYDFYLGDRFSHCGEDAFHLIRRDGVWRIAALTYSVRTTGCATGG